MKQNKEMDFLVTGNERVTLPTLGLTAKQWQEYHELVAKANIQQQVYMFVEFGKMMEERGM